VTSSIAGRLAHRPVRYKLWPDGCYDERSRSLETLISNRRRHERGKREQDARAGRMPPREASSGSRAGTVVPIRTASIADCDTSRRRRSPDTGTQPVFRTSTSQRNSQPARAQIPQQAVRQWLPRANSIRRTCFHFSNNEKGIEGSKDELNEGGGHVPDSSTRPLRRRKACTSTHHYNSRRTASALGIDVSEPGKPILVTAERTPFDQKIANETAGRSRTKISSVATLRVSVDLETG